MADVVGYSRLMGRDEAGTHARLRELREQLVDPRIAAHGGRIVNTSGDGMLLEFPSTTAALRCAVEVQREMAARNAGIKADERIEFRIGINLGDVIVEGEDIAGDGVNVAARLETIAEPGGICVSSLVRDQVHEDLGIGYVDGGEQQLKNIARPVHVFHVALGEGGERGRAIPSWSRRHRRQLVAVVGVLVLAVATFASLRGFQKEPAQKVADPPWGTVLVLPFTAEAGDRELVAQLTMGFTSALGDTLRQARVVPAARAAAIAAETLDPQEAGRRAGARWVIGGELRPSDKDLAFTLRVFDVRAERQVDHTRQDLGRQEVANIEPLMRRLVSSARVMVAAAVFAEKKPGRSTAEDWLQRAEDFTDPDPVVEAREKLRLMDEALKLDPNFAPALYSRAMLRVDVYFDQLSDALGSDRSRVVAEADADTLRAVSLDPQDHTAWVARGLVLALRGNIEAARSALDRAIALDPTRLAALGTRVSASLWAGDPEAALAGVEKLRKDYRLNSAGLQMTACTAHLALGFMNLAIKECEDLAASEDAWGVYAALAAAYALNGDAAKAADQKAKLLKKLPGFTIARYQARGATPEAIAMDQRYFIPGLRKAGVPE
jgi:class 3 adenylate cyclase/tetratricopeptide (TPR) repeat protein